MKATLLRDQIYSRIHSIALRPHGFGKSRRWISKANGLYHYALERPTHRYESPDCASLGLEVYVFHERYHSIMIGYPTFPGVDRMSIPVFRRGIRWLAAPMSLEETVFPDSDVTQIASHHCDAIRDHVLPLFNRCNDLEGMLAVVRELTLSSWRKTQTEVGLLLLLGNRKEAAAALDAAVRNASDAERSLLIGAGEKLNVG